MDSRDVFPYMVTQVIAGVVAALAVLLVKGSPETPPMEISTLPALIAEILFTFALCLVILEVATSKATEGNSYYGIAIGFTFMAGTYAVGGVSGGVFNPAVAVGIIVMGICRTLLHMGLPVREFYRGVFSGGNLQAYPLGRVTWRCAHRERKDFAR